MSSHIIQLVENEQLKAAKQLPDFAPGDTVLVQVKVKEGERVRLQSFEGVVIARRNRGFNSSFTVRKISHGVGVERVFQAYSPTVDSVEVLRRGDVRKAKLYYMRGLSGKSARIREKLSYTNKQSADTSKQNTDASNMEKESVAASHAVTADESIATKKPAAAKASTAKSKKAAK